MGFLPFSEAREFVHKLGIENQDAWNLYCKCGKRPENIPANPRRTYKTDWKGWGDWIGTGTIAAREKEYLRFNDAKMFVQNLRLRSREEWKHFCKSGKKPEDIPAVPSVVYKQNWHGWGDWLGSATIAPKNREFQNFVEAKRFVHILKLTNWDEWSKYCKSGKKPTDIPSNPNKFYKNEWKDWGDWLGTGTIALQKREFMPFIKAKDLVQKLGINSKSEWEKYCRSGEKPTDIPYNPSVYKNWKGWGDWLGTGRIADQDKVYKAFQESKRVVHSLGLKNREEWQSYSNSGKKPQDIPASASQTYKNEWKGWGDWLGTGTIQSQKREYLSFLEGREFTHTLGLKNIEEWKSYCKSGKKPQDIPADPVGVYKTDWTYWGDWLGTGFIAFRNRTYRSFDEAKQFVHKLELKNQDQWFEYCKSAKKPEDIPVNPRDVYKNDWLDMPDWLGYEDPDWSMRRVKELLRDLIRSKIIYQWNEAVLYSFLLRKGVLSLSGNRHDQFFKNLIQASRTEDGRKAMEDYANSDSEIPPDISEFVTQKIQDPGQEIQAATTQELAQLADKKDPLDYGEIQSVEQILANTSVLESINVDEEAMQFYLTYSMDELWKCAFREEKVTVDKIRLEGKNGNKYHDTVVEKFLSDYQGTRSIKVPHGYAFPYHPTLMQSFVAYKAKSLPFFGNFSGTGAGKTLSAVLASRAIDSKMTLIVCPNDVVAQWARNIVEIFPDSFVITGKEAFYVTYDENKYHYLVLNYDKFSQEDSPNLILNLVKQKVDFVVLDEIHFTKVRYEEDVSKRRQNLDGLMTAVRKKNSQMKVLGLSATPVVNNLTEGKSLLELITGKIYEDIATRPTIPNAVTLYEKLSTLSVRELPRYDTHLDDRDIIEVQAERPQNINIKQLKSNPLSIEQFLTDARIPEIINHINGQTMIYTEYVTDVVEKLSHAVEAAGYSYA